MKSSSVSYSCLLDAKPRTYDWLVLASALILGLAAIIICGLAVWIKIAVSLFVLAWAANHARELYRIQRLEWRVTETDVLRVRQIVSEKSVTQAMLQARIEFIGPFVQLRGKLGGRLEYTLIWPWMIDAEQYRRLRRLQFRLNHQDKNEKI
jgi:hypothetical protein